MTKRKWLKEITFEKILADGISNVIWLVAIFSGSAIFGLFKNFGAPWGWAMFTAICVAGTTGSWLFLRRRLREAPPGSLVGQIHQLAVTGHKVKTRDEANDWVHNVYDGLRGLGLQLPATEFEDSYYAIVKADTDEKAFRLVRQAVAWLQGLAARMSVPQQTSNAVQNISAYRSVFEDLLRIAKDVSTRAQALAFWSRLSDAFYALRIQHLLSDFKPAMRVILNDKKDEDDVSLEVQRIQSLLGTFIRLTVIPANESGVGANGELSD